MNKFDDYFNPAWESLNESQQNEIDEIIEKLKGIDNLEEVDESILSNIIGGGLGFLIGPDIGRKIANALGITQGILLDLFCSRLVNTALGAAIAKRL
jgi:uncharacterized protein YcfJ